MNETDYVCQEYQHKYNVENTLPRPVTTGCVIGESRMDELDMVARSLGSYDLPKCSIECLQLGLL